MQKDMFHVFLFRLYTVIIIIYSYWAVEQVVFEPVMFISFNVHVHRKIQ